MRSTAHKGMDAQTRDFFVSRAQRAVRMSTQAAEREADCAR